MPTSDCDPCLNSPGCRGYSSLRLTLSGWTRIPKCPHAYTPPTFEVGDPSGLACVLIQPRTISSARVIEVYSSPEPSMTLRLVSLVDGPQSFHDPDIYTTTKTPSWSSRIFSNTSAPIPRAPFYNQDRFVARPRCYTDKNEAKTLHLPLLIVGFAAPTGLLVTFLALDPNASHMSYLSYSDQKRRPAYGLPHRRPPPPQSPGHAPPVELLQIEPHREEACQRAVSALRSHARWTPVTPPRS